MADILTLSPAGTQKFNVDDSGNVTAAGTLTVTGAAAFNGGATFADSDTIILGTGSDDTIGHDGTLTTWTHTTGDLLIDNTDVNDQIILRVGTDTSATGVEIRNNSDVAVFSVVPASASAGTTQVVGTLDLNGDLDLDHALTAAGDLANIAGTINHATAVAEGLDLSITQLTTSRSAGTVSALKVATTSLAGDSGGTYAGIYLSHTDGGGSAVHTGLYGDTALDAFAIASASGKMGFTVGAMTAKSPETDVEAGFITIRVGSTAYEIPFYAVS